MLLWAPNNAKAWEGVPCARKRMFWEALNSAIHIHSISDIGWPTTKTILLNWTVCVFPLLLFPRPCRRSPPSISLWRDRFAYPAGGRDINCHLGIWQAWHTHKQFSFRGFHEEKAKFQLIALCNVHIHYHNIIGTTEVLIYYESLIWRGKMAVGRRCSLWAGRFISNLVSGKTLFSFGESKLEVE